MGPFSPASTIYTLENTGGQALEWSAVGTQTWVTLSDTGGTLDAGAVLDVTVSINGTADGLSAGSYNDTITFTNTTFDYGTTTRDVALTVTGAGNSNPLGINLTEVGFWTPEWIWVDAFRKTKPWMCQSADSSIWDTGEPLDMDADGWVRSLAYNRAAGTVMLYNLNGHYPAGDYVCLYDGTGAIQFGRDGHIVSSEPGRIVVNVNPTNQGIHLKVVATDPADYVRNIRMIMPGFESTYETQPFHPLFLERLNNPGFIRHMNWLRTNNSTHVNWSDRTPYTYYTQATTNGVSVEEMIDLCNRTNADAWFCMPHQATDAYIEQFAILVRDTLNPNLKAYVEHSNEVWNSTFSQYEYARQQGIAMGFTSSSALKYHSVRSVQIFEIWEQVFGSTDRLVRVLAGQHANPSAGVVVMDFQDAYQSADVWAVAPYFGGIFGRTPLVSEVVNWSVDELLDACEGDILTRRQMTVNHVNNANARGLSVIAYEGGQHLRGGGSWEQNPTLTALFIATNRHPRMQDLYLMDMNGWREAGGTWFAVYESVYIPTYYGSWGVLEYQDQDLSTAPKYLGLDEFKTANPVWW